MDDLVQKGYEAFDDKMAAEGLRFGREAWEIFETVMKEASRTENLYDLMEAQDCIYPIDEWLQDYEMELGNADKYEERIAFCQKVLEIFD